MGKKGVIGTLARPIEIETRIHRIFWPRFGYLFFDRKKNNKFISGLNRHLNGSSSSNGSGGSGNAYDSPMHLLFLLTVVVVTVAASHFFFFVFVIVVKRLPYIAVSL